MTELLNISQIDSLNELNSGPEEDILGELIEIYKSQTPNLINQIKLHFKAGNFDDLKKMAHKLKGSSANIGLKSLAENCSKLEEMSSKIKDPNNPTYKDLIEGLEKLYTKSTIQLDEYRKKK